MPYHKRKPIRLNLLQGFIYPLIKSFDAFLSWRSDVRLTINVTSQVIILQSYLRKKYNANIVVSTYDDEGLFFPLKVEANNGGVWIGLLIGESFVELPIQGEYGVIFEDADLIVYIPENVEKGEVVADIEKFKQVLISYKVNKNEKTSTRNRR